PAANATNAPGEGDIYSLPQNMLYAVNSVQRKRTNAQATLQFRPVDNLTATLDYTFSENRIQQRRHELSTWFNQLATASSWTDGPVAAPTSYTEAANGADLAMAGAFFATKNENKSLGFNVDWAASDALSLEFDYHHSTAESGADRSEEHTSELQSRENLVCRLLLEKKNTDRRTT